MKIAILGSGNVATHLSKAFIKARHPVLQVWSRNNENAINLALEIGADSILSIADLSDEVELQAENIYAKANHGVKCCENVGDVADVTQRMAGIVDFKTKGVGNPANQKERA